MKRFFYALAMLVAFASLGLAAEVKKKPPIDPTQGGGAVVVAPMGIPPLPNPGTPVIGGGGDSQPHSGGGGGDYPPPPTYQPPKLPDDPLGVKHRKVIRAIERRNRIYVSRYESNYRSNIFAQPDGKVASVSEVNPEQRPIINDMTLGLDTALREAINDAVASHHELESDKFKLLTQQQLHAQSEALRKKQAITDDAYEESLAKLKKAESRVEASQARADEFDAEVRINKWKHAQLQGTSVSLVEKAQSYVDLWAARAAKVRQAEKEAQAEWDYRSAGLDRTMKLYKAHATSREDVINAQQAIEEASVVKKLARALVENNERFYAEAKKTLQQVQQMP